MLYVSLDNQVQISMKGMQLDEKKVFLETLREKGYDHSIELNVFDVGLLIDTGSKIIIRTMNKTLDHQPGISDVPTVQASNF